MIRKIKEKISSNKILLANFSYITLLQVIILLTPLITYPYLIKTIGKELYGYVLSAQVLASYATIVIRFGFDAVSSRHISIFREDHIKLQNTMSAIMVIRMVLWVTCLLLYVAIVNIIPAYRDQTLLFILSYGMTFQILLFPQFFFQGIEDMKFITVINVIIQLIFTILIFIIVKGQNDYIYIPLIYTSGYLVGGLVSLIILRYKYNLTFSFPEIEEVRYHLKDAFPLFLTDSITTIKDKLNYILLGICVNMSDVVIYDFGAKLTTLAIQPLQIINTVVFPRMAKEKNNRQFFLFGVIVILAIILIVVTVNIFLRYIVEIFIGPNVDLLPLRVFLLAPIFLGIGSYIASSYIIARGHVKYMLYSIIVTTTIYLFALGALFFNGSLNSVLSFVGLTVFAYMIEMMYRIIILIKLIKKDAS